METKRMMINMKCNKPILSWRKGKKRAVRACYNGEEKIIHYGATGYQDYTQHKDKTRRINFRKRHRCDSKKPNMLSARYWACEDLW
jgi:hypothetical protein